MRRQMSFGLVRFEPVLALSIHSSTALGAGPAPAHLFQGLHELLYWNGAAQQRLQHFAVRNVLAHPLPLLTAGGLGGLGRGLGQKESVPLSERSSLTPWSGPAGLA